MAAATSTSATTTTSTTLPSSDQQTFSTQIRREFSRHRQEWMRYYCPLIELLNQRGLLARLDRLSRYNNSSKPASATSSQTFPTQGHNNSTAGPSSKEVFTCLAATTTTLTEWALKLHNSTSERWTVARNAVFFVDEFGLALLERLQETSPPYQCVGEGNPSDTPFLADASTVCCSAAELGLLGAKARASRRTLGRNLCELSGRGSTWRRAEKSGIFAGMLGWVERLHGISTRRLVVGKVCGAKLPAELLEMIIAALDDDAGGGEKEEEEADGAGEMREGFEPSDRLRWLGVGYGREEARVLARAGVARLEVVGRRAAITAS